MENLAHGAFLDSDDKDASSKPGDQTAQLAPRPNRAGTQTLSSSQPPKSSQKFGRTLGTDEPVSVTLD